MTCSRTTMVKCCPCTLFRERRASLREQGVQPCRGGDSSIRQHVDELCCLGARTAAWRILILLYGTHMEAPPSLSMKQRETICDAPDPLCLLIHPVSTAKQATLNPFCHRRRKLLILATPRRLLCSSRSACGTESGKGWGSRVKVSPTDIGLRC